MIGLAAVCFSPYIRCSYTSISPDRGSDAVVATSTFSLRVPSFLDRPDPELRAIRGCGSAKLLELSRQWRNSWEFLSSSC